MADSISLTALAMLAGAWQSEADSGRGSPDRREAVRDADAVCVAWGANAAGLSRPGEVLTLLRDLGVDTKCLAITRSGHACAELRYGYREIPEPCECLCHDWRDDDDDLG